ncbi:MAG: AbrB/MazE/SpoVT family DNA-binding domain-containing protein [Micavibrio sp.]|nr:MAG: AbrB/MazE/SpoVT family DNA-binding domain-containing protein [Micavibrio sp.]
MPRTVIRKIGNSVGILLTKEHLAHLQAEEGDEVFVIKTEEGLTISAYDPDFAKQLDSAEKIMNKYKNALHELAK